MKAPLSCSPTAEFLKRSAIVIACASTAVVVACEGGSSEAVRAQLPAKAVSTGQREGDDEARGTPAEAVPAACVRLSSIALPSTTIVSAQFVAAGAFVAPATSALPPDAPQPDYGGLPAFCRVRASITPVPNSEIKVEVWLPAEGWNGKLVGVGNGGMAGEIFYVSMGDPLLRGYAVAATDTGHEGGEADTSFAVGQPEKLVDFGWRAVHEMTVKAKKIIAAHYAEPPRRSYWLGCSSGGRQGLKEAQRFPGDYDGIAAGAPANNWFPLLAYSAKVQSVMADPETALSVSQLQALKEAAIAACDADDGVTDGVVEDPRMCSFDSANLQCTSDAAGDCLTSQQVEGVRSIYAGIVDRNTGKTLMPGPTPGSELAWQAYTTDVFPIGLNYWRDIVFSDPDWEPVTLDFTDEIRKAIATDAGDLMAVDADLSAFAAGGGKLLLWHGWTDGLIPAQNSIDYFEDVLATIDPKAAQRSVRLFMAPGVDHCSGGEGTFDVDALATIDQWVEQGESPDRIVASRPLEEGGERTRPLCPYPRVARYTGTGSTDDAANFQCEAPSSR